MELILNDPRLGKKYEDIPTGLKGTCVGVWISYGSTQIQLARISSDSNLKHDWVDEKRLRELLNETDGVGFR